MRKIKTWMPAAILLLCGTSLWLSSCESCRNGRTAECSYVAGTLDGPLEPDSAPSRLAEAMTLAQRFHNYEIISDTSHDIGVDAIGEADATPTEGYGIVVVKGSTSTTFIHLRNSRQPKARYDAAHDVLWLTCSAMEGSGVQVERLCQIRFHDNDTAYISADIDPYAVQQLLCQRIGYVTDGSQITLYDGERQIASVTDSVADMGDIDTARPLWIGEQLCYDLSGDTPCLLVTPGVKFADSPVLAYDDMPTLKAHVAVGADGTVSIGDITALKEQ